MVILSQDLLLRPVTNVKFCESRYIVVPYVAEFWNSISGIVLAIPAFILFWRTSRARKGSSSVHRVGVIGFDLIALATLGVSLGTILFHGTMSRWAQAIDELSIVFLTTACHYQLWEGVLWPGLIGTKSIVGVLAFLAVFSVVYILLPAYWSVFMIVGNILGITSLVLQFKAVYFPSGILRDALTLPSDSATGGILRGSERQSLSLRERIFSRSSILFLTSWGSGILGFVIWNIDLWACTPLVESLKLHAWWHVLGAINFHFQYQLIWELTMMRASGKSADE